MHAHVDETGPRSGMLRRWLVIVDRLLHPVVRCDVCGADVRLERSMRLPRGTAVVRRHYPINRPPLRR